MNYNSLTSYELAIGLLINAMILDNVHAIVTQDQSTKIKRQPGVDEQTERQILC